jgi:hypothetical protein
LAAAQLELDDLSRNVFMGGKVDPADEEAYLAK